MGSQAQVTRKRTKDTSGPETSPNTSQCRPVAKRLTAETEPLSDSSNDQ